MLKEVASVAVFLAAGVAAQTTSYESDRPSPVRGDADKIVCQAQEKIGTRLGAKNVCLTVAEWRARQDADREQTEGIQAGTRIRCSNDSGCDPPGEL